MAFHECLYEGARNPYLRQEILRMRMRTQAYRKHAFGALGRLSISHRSHALIVKAIVAKNSAAAARSEEHTSELQSLMRISYAVFCLKKNNTIKYKVILT